MSITKQELFQAFREVASLEFAEIPRDNSHIQLTFSRDFEDRMNVLIKQMSKESKKSLKDFSEFETY